MKEGEKKKYFEELKRYRLFDIHTTPMKIWTHFLIQFSLKLYTLHIDTESINSMSEITVIRQQNMLRVSTCY